MGWTSAGRLTSYSGVVGGLESAFTKVSVTGHLLVLRSLRYSDEEPLSAFVIRFKKLVKLAFPSQVDLTPLLFSYFLASLPPEFYAAVVADGVSLFDPCRPVEVQQVFLYKSNTVPCTLLHSSASTTARRCALFPI